MKKIFDFLNEQVLPSKVFKMNSKMFNNLYVKCFENKKVRVNLYGDDFENWDQEGGNLAAGGSPTPEPYIPSRFVLSKKIVDLKAQMNEKESLLEDKSNKLVEVGTLLEQKEDQIGILQKKRAGEKSGHVRVKRSQITPINEIPVEVCDGNDYISITERLTGCGNIFLGKEIFGSKSGKKSWEGLCRCSIFWLRGIIEATEFIFDN